jgi:polysaccharide pyruvyl transferase WcaK-like protein
VFVPHVYSTQPLNDDQGFLSALAEELRKIASPPVLCPASRLTAGEAKWLISRCECFVGARTHATIAAFSSGVPTLSLAYSRKAAGLNKDLFGDLRYCVHAEELVPGLIAERLTDLVSNGDGVRERLRESAAEMSRRAMRAGSILAACLAHNTTPAEIVRKNE